jgi:hypothetical protein
MLLLVHGTNILQSLLEGGEKRRDEKNPFALGSNASS